MTHTFYVQLLLAALSDGSWQGYVVFALLGAVPFLCTLGMVMMLSERVRRVVG